LKQQQRRLIIGVSLVLLAGLCLLTSFIALSSGLGLWFFFNSEAESAAATPRPTRQIASAPTFTPTATPTPILTATPSPTSTPTPPPTETPSPTPLPPTPTPEPPTATPSPPPVPPTATPQPTDTPAPSYPFAIVETAGFPTNHENFDVYVAITDANNKPLSGYRLLGTHSSGLQVDSQVSAGDWTVNSGAMHYKGGNVKYEAFNSPTGIWTLQLVNEANQPVAPPVEFPFDAGSPAWYFLLYRRQ
jgi:hypothetical protein